MTEPDSQKSGIHDKDPKLPPHRSLGYLLPRVAHSLNRDFDTMLASFGIRSTHLGVLSTIRAFGPLSQNRIALYLGLERQTLVNLSDELEKRGYLERQPNPADRRQHLLSLTPAGLAFQEEVDAAAAQHQAEVFGVLTPEESDLFEAVLVKLASSGHFDTLFSAPKSEHEE